MVDETKENSADDCLSKFFKVYLPDESGDDLELPISFNSCLPKSLPKTVIVRSIYGNMWKMVLRKCDGEVEKYFLVDGWKRIVKDEDLKGGEFLAFEFDGSRLFNFCIYGHATCKKPKSSVQCKEIDQSDGEDGNSSDVIIVLDDEDDDDDDSEDSEYRYADDNDGDDYADDAAAVEEDDDDGDDYAVDNDADDAAFEEDDNDFEAVDPGDDAAFEDDDDDDERRYLDDRLNPSFTMTLNPKKKSQLLIPTRVIKDYDLHFPERITIVDPLVENFGTLEKKIKIQTNGSVFVKGFGSIIRRNKVKTTDKMIFEIKKTGNDNLVQTIKVHIISG